MAKRPASKKIEPTGTPIPEWPPLAREFRTDPISYQGPSEQPQAGPEVFASGRQIMHLSEGRKLEMFNGHEWVELRGDNWSGGAARLQGYSMKGTPEGYVRADSDNVLLWPIPIHEFLFRVTTP